MRPIRTDYSNITYVADGCGDLPATLFKDQNGNYEVETVWELTDEEIERIRKEKKLYLYTRGRQVQPLLISAESYVSVD